MQLLKKEYLMLRLKRMFTRMFWILPLNNKKLFFRVMKENSIHAIQGACMRLF